MLGPFFSPQRGVSSQELRTDAGRGLTRVLRTVSNPDGSGLDQSMFLDTKGALCGGVIIYREPEKKQKREKIRPLRILESSFSS